MGAAAMAAVASGIRRFYADDPIPPSHFLTDFRRASMSVGRSAGGWASAFSPEGDLALHAPRNSRR